MSSSGSRTPRMPNVSTSFSSSSMPVRAPRARQERNTNFKVVIRIRPPLPREVAGDVKFKNVLAVNDSEQCLTVSENIEEVVDNDGNLLANPGPHNIYSYTFDQVYDQYSTQEAVYETTARAVVDSALQGYNATIFAYGQTGAGKTYTMEGFNREGSSIESRGIIPRAIEQIFNHIQRFASPRMKFLVRAAYLQIYNEIISDLLKPERENLKIVSDKKRGIHVEFLSEWVVRSPAEIYGLMERGGAVRATGETRMNDFSSRSHAVFIIIAEQSETVYVDDQGAELTPEEFQKFMHRRGVHREQDMVRLEDHVKQTFKVGKLNLVDLAGSERVERSGAQGLRLKESQNINKSLTMLGIVISTLVKDPHGHIPYRNSKLTRVLEDSLGGNCKTTMMAMVSPAHEAMQETISTLKFANQAKNIRNEARVNEDLDQKSLLRKYEKELKQLRAELEEKNRNVVDKRRLLEIDEQRRRAEADKMAAIRALEVRSQEFMKEKEEKKRLEQRIAALTNKITGGPSLDHPGPGGEVVMKEQQDKLRREYEFKLADLERERETIEEEKAQVDRYKQLLLKQRDIMIALTQRLVERDEQIMALQDELDAYDRHHKELEEKLDEKTALLIKLQRISMEVNSASPHKSEELTKALESWAEGERMRNNGPTEVMDDELPATGRGGQGAEDKIRQLSALVESQKLQLSAMEHKLQESRHHGHAGGSHQDQALRDENDHLKRRLAQLESTSDSASHLQTKCDTLAKERVAIQQIFENKIKVLVRSVAQSAGAVISSAEGLSGSSAGQALLQDVNSLQKLVSASITALHNAAASNPHVPSPHGNGAAAALRSSIPAAQPNQHPPMPPMPSSSPYIPHDHAFTQSSSGGWKAPAAGQGQGQGQLRTQPVDRQPSYQQQGLGLPKWDS